MIVWLIFVCCILFLLKQYFRGGQYKGIKSDLSGKVAIITGGNSGIGKQTALDLAKQGCYIIIGSRNTQKSDQVIKEIGALTNSQKLEQHYLDLSRKNSIK